MLLSTEQINRVAGTREVERINMLLKPLGIDNIKVNNQDFIYNTEKYIEEVGIFFKRKVEVISTIVSYRVNFTIKDKPCFIYLNDRQIENDHELYDLFKKELRFKYEL